MRNCQKRILLTIIVSIIFICTSFGQSMLNNNSTEFTPTSVGGELLWKLNVESVEVLSSANFADVDGDGILEVIIGSEDFLYCINNQGEIKWKSIMLPDIVSKPAIADLDNDTTPEIIIGTSNQYLYCLSHTGEIEWDFPCNWYIETNPIIADLDYDGTFEIVFRSYSYTYCLSHNGSLEWRKATSSRGSSAAIADLDNDNKAEIVYAAYSIGIGPFYIKCLNHSGNSVWTFTTPAVIRYVTIADLDNDNDFEIICGGDDNNIYCLNHTGGFKWSHNTGDIITTSAAFADINNDSFLEVVIGSHDDNLYCLDYNGDIVWTYATGGSIQSSPAIADLNNDGLLEVIVGSSDNKLHCVSNNGTKIWDYTVGGNIQSSPLIIDLDRDGIFEILFGSDDSYFYCLGLTGVTSSGMAPWRSLSGSFLNTGRIDSDNDYIDDFSESFYKTDPYSADTDIDGLSDFEEITLGIDNYVTDPTNADTDSDGYSDFEEYESGTNPLDKDSNPRTRLYRRLMIVGIVLAILVVVIVSILISIKRKHKQRLIVESEPKLPDLEEVIIEDYTKIDFEDKSLLDDITPYVETIEDEDIESGLEDEPLIQEELPIIISKRKISHTFLSNLLRVKSILVITKDGIPIVTLNFGQKLDSSLAGGFLTAVTNFGAEIIDDKQISENKFVQMGQEGGIFWIFEGKLVRFALLLNSTPSNEFKKPIWKTLKRFERKYEQELEDFTGNVSVFEPSQRLLESSLAIYYLYSMKINPEELENSKLSNKKFKDVIETYFENFSDDVIIDVHQLIDSAFKDLKDITFNEILTQIIFLVKNEVLIPIPQIMNED